VPRMLFRAQTPAGSNFEKVSMIKEPKHEEAYLRSEA
jgi:hypothetical protein